MTVPLSSRTSTLDEIKQTLKNPDIYMIGVCGFDGVGKTTLMNELALQVTKDGSFGVVVMITITNSSNVENIQGQIANVLDLKFNEETKEGRATQLYHRIRSEKNILVILDDVWEKLDLTKVGIPFGDDHKGCKLVLTASKYNVLKRLMGTQKDFRLEILSEEDSWNLFKNIAGYDDVDIKAIAQKIVKRCDGLPLTIVIVAKALWKRNFFAWKKALYQLERLDEKGMLKEVICPLELSFNNLERDELKSLFLFIVLFELDYIPSGELFSCYWGMGFYKNVKTLSEARNKHYKLINELRACSLLLEDRTEYVRMHDLVRDMAKSIASRTHQTYGVQTFTQIKEWENDTDKLKKCHYIILPSYNIDEIPEMLDCPELKLVLLRRSIDYLTIPDNFFSCMREIKVLDLHGMRFTPCPPPSLRLLTNLRSLNLYDCMLGDITSIAELKNLEILVLEGSQIEKLPKEIGQLAHLRMLNLTNCFQLRVIPANLISSLTCLEELYMGNCNIQWEVEGSEIQTDNASLCELRNLHQLKALDISIQDALTLPTNLLVFKKLERYNIFIGNMWKWPLSWSGGACKTSRTLKLADSLNTNICLNEEIKFLFTTVEDLTLAKLEFVSNESYNLDGKYFPQLRHLHIQNSEAFHSLETLDINNMQNMVEISYGPLSIHSFEKLRVIKVKDCKNLKNLHLCFLARNFSQLQELEISTCDVMRGIIIEEKPKDEKEFFMITLPKLYSLKLNTLPMLLSFSLPLAAEKDNQLIHLPLFNEKVAMPNLKTMELCSINTNKIWDDKFAVHSSFQNITSLIIDCCDSLTSLFSSSMATTLVKLQDLRIANCSKLKEIFVEEEKDTFPNLETLVIGDVANLMSIWPNKVASNSFCKLNKIKIYGCKGLDHVFPISMVEKLQQLQVLEISRCPIENIFENNNSHDATPVSLKKLDVSWCFKLQTIVPSSIVFPTLDELRLERCGGLVNVATSMDKSLPNIRIMSVSFCSILENIFGSKNEGNALDDVAFMKLEELELKYLPTLTSICARSYSLSFPSLHTLHLIRCPKMVTYRHGNLPTLSMATLQSGRIVGKGRWDHDLNKVNTVRALFDEKATFPNLGTLVIQRMYRLKSLWHDQVAPDSFHKLKKLQIIQCEGWSHVFPISVVQRLGQLQLLEISQSEIKDIIEIFQSEIEDIIEISQSEIKNIVEISKSETEDIIERIVTRRIKHVYLEKLVVTKCVGLKTIVQSLMLYQTLDELHVSCCHEMVNIITPSMAASLPSLRILSISDCGELKEVFGSPDKDKPIEITFMKLVELKLITFMKLEELKLEKLPKLLNFCMGTFSFNFPSLQTVEVIQCPRMVTFCHGDFQKFIPLVLFNEKVIEMPNLVTLRLHFIDSPTIWDNESEVPPSIQNLTSFEVHDCKSLTSLFSSFVAGALVKLQYLKISSCSELREIFIKGEEVTFPNLETIIIDRMDYLRFIWPNQVASNSFCKLQMLEISSTNIENIVEKTDKHDVELYLKKLTLNRCDGLKTIVQSSVIFRSLDALEVNWCSVVNIVTLSTTTSIPSLRILSVSNCLKLEEIFSSKNKLKLGSMNMGDTLREITPMKLEQSKPGSNNMGDAPGEIASMKVEELKLGSKNEDNVPRKITSMKMEELKFGDKNKDNASRIVEMSDSHEVKSVYLEILNVYECDSLRTIVQSWVLFESLDKLEVSGCAEVTNIIMSSMIPNLPSLRILSISNCRKLQEIFESRNESDALKTRRKTPMTMEELKIQSENIGESQREITFMSLEEVKLENLPMITSFCNERFNFNFPSLQIVHVIGCPRMKTFCYGKLATPRLKTVTRGRKEENCWDGDLNTTLRSL